jgi:signal transduction histidine kinase
LANLIDNALKYSSRGGGVFLTLAEDDTSVNIEVSDAGVGIAEEDMPNIFQRFYRGDQSRSQPGSGLGLSLAQAFVKSHGGEITVVSRSGHGSTFAITLPKAPSLMKSS